MIVHLCVVMNIHMFNTAEVSYNTFICCTIKWYVHCCSEGSLSFQVHIHDSSSGGFRGGKGGANVPPFGGE